MKSISEANWKRIGWKGMLKRAVELDVFSIEGKNKIESVYYSPFELVFKYFNYESATL